jgi:hypothetical protein
VGLNLGNFLPRDAHASATTKPGGETANLAGSGTPDARADEEGNYARGLARPAFDCDVVDLPTPPAFAVEELVIQQSQAEVEFLAHP